VLDNLVSNALKFTPEGGRVEVRTSTTDDYVYIEVEDSGVGIPAAEQPRLFERFFRAASATEQAIPGTGLGLAIVKAIVEAHAGRIEVVSAPGKGTTFRVELPLREVRSADPVEVAA
jgi:signal transduction histidine kinase